jgi:hypothetical protein
MNVVRKSSIGALCTIVALLSLAGCGQKQEAATESKPVAKAEDASGPDLIELKKIAEEGFIYGLPIVMNYGVMYEYAVDKNSTQFKAPFNQINNEARVYTYKDTAVVTPNSDTPYSITWLDLRAEPIVLSVPEVEKDRYYSVMLEDGNTFIYGYIGSRATGNKAGSYLVVGPRWTGDTPEGIEKVFHSTTDFAITIYRTQLLNPEDMPNVVKVQEGYKVQPLSEFLGTTPPAPAPVIDFPVINKELSKKNFFDYLAFSLQFAPAGEEEKEIRAKLASMGVEPGKKFDLEALPLDRKAAIADGMKAGESKVKDYIANKLIKLNGWQIASYFGDREHYNGDWLLRAAGAQAGIYGNDSVEAAYPLTYTDADGDKLDGSKHNYTLTFPKGEFPPVNAFWSVTMYDGKTQLLIENPINRYLVNSPMLPDMKTNDDGSVTIYIQNKSPGKDKESNWLPAPDGPIYLAMRLYWPRTEEPSILPIGKGTWQPPAVKKAAQ